MVKRKHADMLTAIDAFNCLSRNKVPYARLTQPAVCCGYRWLACRYFQPAHILVHTFIIEDFDGPWRMTEGKGLLVLQ